MKILSAIALAALAVVAQVVLARQRPSASSSIAESAFTALGGFRSLMAEIVWFRADRLQEEGRYVELAQLAHALTLTEPHNAEVWSYAAWNLAYNVSLMMPSADDRWRWVDAAIRLLRDDGLRYNPDSAELYRQLAWMFELKLGLEVDTAAPVYRVRWRELVDDVAARDAWSELGMDRERMRIMERSLGVTDRGDPFYSALYWAGRGLECATDKERTFLKMIVSQSLTLYQRNH